MPIRWTSLLLAAVPGLAAAGCLVAADVVPPARTVDAASSLTLGARRVVLSADIARSGFSDDSTVVVDVDLQNGSDTRRTVLPAAARLILHDAASTADFAGEAVAADQLIPPCAGCRHEQRVDAPAIPAFTVEPGGTLRLRLTFRAFPERTDGRPVRATLQLPLEGGPRLALTVVDPGSPAGPRLQAGSRPIEVAGFGARARWLGGPWGGPAFDPLWQTLWVAGRNLAVGMGWSLGMMSPDATRANGPMYSGSAALNAAWTPHDLPVGAFLSAEVLWARLRPPAFYRAQGASSDWLIFPSVTAGLLIGVGDIAAAHGPLPVEGRRTGLRRLALLAAYTRFFETGERWGSGALTLGFVVTP